MLLHSHLPSAYLAFFSSFNAARYYEAHDVLEAHWLVCFDPNRSFYQALIQLAGAFVHLQKHAQFPTHPTHARRLSPARRLLLRARSRLEAYPPVHLCLDLRSLQTFCDAWASACLLDNPLHHNPPLQLTLLAPLSGPTLPH